VVVAFLSAVIGIGLISVVLWECFETIVLPRRVTRRFRLTRLFYRRTWLLWSGLGNRLFSGMRLETWLSYFGPLSLLFLLGFWAIVLIFGFAFLYFAAGSSLNVQGGAPGFFTDVYLSGTNFFTLGLGDVTPHSSAGRFLTVAEAGLGFGFLALVIGYLPALNQSFSKREVSISLLDARAGTPPTAAGMLIRHGHEHGMEALRQVLSEWELWSAELMESHLSYPVLAYFRSQHDNQSWLGALTSVLDTCALIMTGLEGACGRQAELTFAIARHAVVDLALVFRVPPQEPRRDRLPEAELDKLRSMLADAGLRLHAGEESGRKLTELRSMYEPYVYSLSRRFQLAIPPWMPASARSDNWQTSAWEKRNAGLPAGKINGGDENGHF
jgi:hypothetical protein